MAPKPDRRTSMLEHGQRLALAQGYTATTVDAICEAAEVTKGSFFHHFKSKDDFGSQLVAFTWAPVAAQYESSSPDGDIADRLREHITFMASWIADVGRLIPMMVQELGTTNPEVRAQIGGYFSAWTARLERLIEEAATQSGAAVDVEGLKEFIIATTEGVPVANNQFGPHALSSVTARLVRAVLAEVGLSD